MTKPKRTGPATYIAEGVFDLLTLGAITLMVSGHRWLDVTLWAVAIAGVAGAIWQRSWRRRAERRLR